MNQLEQKRGWLIESRIVLSAENDANAYWSKLSAFGMYK